MRSRLWIIFVIVAAALIFAVSMLYFRSRPRPSASSQTSRISESSTTPKKPRRPKPFKPKGDLRGKLLQGALDEPLSGGLLVQFRATVERSKSGKVDTTTNRQEAWIRSDRIRIEDKENQTVSIYRLGKGVLWEIDLNGRTYDEIDTDRMRQVSSAISKRSSRGAYTRQVEEDDEGGRHITILANGKPFMEAWFAPGTDEEQSRLLKRLLTASAVFSPHIDVLGGLLEEEGNLTRRRLHMNMGPFSIVQTTEIESVEKRDIEDHYFELPSGLTKRTSRPEPVPAKRR